MVVEPEQARLLSEFEGQFMEENDPGGFNIMNKVFLPNIFSRSMSSMSNPFMDDCPELLALDSPNCATEAVVDTVRRIRTLVSVSITRFWLCTE